MVGIPEDQEVGVVVTQYGPAILDGVLVVATGGQVTLDGVAVESVVENGQVALVGAVVVLVVENGPVALDGATVVVVVVAGQEILVGIREIQVTCSCVTFIFCFVGMNYVCMYVGRVKFTRKNDRRSQFPRHQLYLPSRNFSREIVQNSYILLFKIHKVSESSV